jgi:hypothetical protein
MNKYMNNITAIETAISDTCTATATTLDIDAMVP